MVGARLKNSLVSQARQLAGRTVREAGRLDAGGMAARPGSLSGPAGAVVPTPAPPVRPAPDGYVRRSPVQPLYRSSDYYRRLVLRAVGTAVLLAAACAGIYLLLHLKLFRL